MTSRSTCVLGIIVIEPRARDCRVTPREMAIVSGKTFEILFARPRVRARIVPLAALLAAACGTSPTAAPPASGPTSGSVDTPQGRVEISLQGGTFAQGPEAVQGFTPPQGLQAPYGAVRFTARVGQPGGALTLRVRLPQPLMLGSSLLKQVGTSHLPIPIEASGNEVVYRIAVRSGHHQRPVRLGLEGRHHSPVRAPRGF
jgi:hypothetical protein